MIRKIAFTLEKRKLERISIFDIDWLASSEQ
jgi:hypothetical protein